MRQFQGLQFPHQRVIFGVGYFRRIENVILVFVMADAFPELRGAFLGGHVGLN